MNKRPLEEVTVSDGGDVKRTHIEDTPSTTLTVETTITTTTTTTETIIIEEKQVENTPSIIPTTEIKEIPAAPSTTLTVETKDSQTSETKDVPSTTTAPQQDSAPVSGLSLSCCVKGLPKTLDKKKFTKLLESHSIKFKKATKVFKNEFGFINFETVEQKEDAMKKLQGVQVKGYPIIVEERKEKATSGPHNSNTPRNNNNTQQDKPTDPNQAFAPLWNTPYDEQLQMKKKLAEDILDKMVKDMVKSDKKDRPNWVREGTSSIRFDGVRSSPLTNKYRNKVEFTIEYDINGAPCIGFVSGKFLEGQHIMEPSNVVVVPTLALALRDAMQTFILSSSLLPYNLRTQVGFWRLLTIKAYARTSEVMAIVQVNPSGVDPTVFANEKARLVEFITQQKNSGLVITSVMCQEHSGNSVGFSGESPSYNLWGASHVHEKLFDQKFRISPNAFFQTNTNGAEIIYSIVRDWCSPTSNSVLLDLCCGTGTIGQCVASQVKQVVGIELSEEAIQDAKVNAELNGHKNTTYIAGKVEDVLKKSFNDLPKGPIIAVVDPPRPGLHKDVLHAIRANTFIKRLVYVSCEPTSLVGNSTALCRSASKRFDSPPFRPVRAIAVDMFPHTRKLEMIVLFEREETKK